MLLNTHKYKRKTPSFYEVLLKRRIRKWLLTLSIKYCVEYFWGKQIIHVFRLSEMTWGVSQILYLKFLIFLTIFPLLSL